MSKGVKYVYAVMVGTNVEGICSTMKQANEIAESYNKYYDYELYYVKPYPLITNKINLEAPEFKKSEFIQCLLHVRERIKEWESD